jgi:hypothetical protein
MDISAVSFEHGTLASLLTNGFGIDFDCPGTDREKQITLMKKTLCTQPSKIRISYSPRFVSKLRRKSAEAREHARY